MESEIPVTEARARFSELVNRVGYGHERITLTRHGKPLVTLVPAAESNADEPNADEPAADEPAETTVLDLASRATASTPDSHTLVARGPHAPRA